MLLIIIHDKNPSYLKPAICEVVLHKQVHESKQQLVQNNEQTPFSNFRIESFKQALARHYLCCLHLPY